MTNKSSQLLKNVNLVTGANSVDNLFARMFSSKGPFVISFINAQAYNLAMSNDTFFSNLIASDILLRDGVGMKIMFHVCGYNPGENLNGTDFIPVLLDKCNPSSIVLIGTKLPYAELARHHQALAKHNVVYLDHGFKGIDDYLANIINIKPDVILLGMGMPKQEMLATVLKNRLKHDCLIINGGAILDFLSGHVPRAPQIFRRVGLEWFYRLCIEPRRLWKRYTIGNVLFLLKVIKNCFDQECRAKAK